jgi:hypothetical protein
MFVQRLCIYIFEDNHEKLKELVKKETTFFNYRIAFIWIFTTMPIFNANYKLKNKNKNKRLSVEKFHALNEK